MQRHIDQFDQEAIREANAISKMRSHLRNPEKPEGGNHRPIRLFTNIICYGVEHLSPKSYKRFQRLGLYNQYRRVRNENKQPGEKKCE